MSTSRSEIGRAGVLALLGSMFLSLAVATTARAQSACFGDCSNDGAVTVNEIITCVNIDLGTSDLSACPICSSNGTTVVISDILKAVNSLLNNCGATPVPTTPGGATVTPTATAMPTTNCPLQPGQYAITSLNVCTDQTTTCHKDTDCPTGQKCGGTLTTSTFTPFVFPQGGVIKADVAAPNAECVHDVVVPYPGGFVSPIFCVPALGYTVTVVQTACGRGQIDSDGGSDYTVTELGDSSYDSTKDSNHTTTCSIAEPGCREGKGPAPDSSILVRVKVGDGMPDTCTSGASNALLSIPVHTTTWLALDAHGNTNGCPDMDGMISSTDNVIVEFNQILDFTSDNNSAMFKDLDGDGCSQTGAGPKGPFAPSGSCLDLSKLNTGKVAELAVASGAIGSSGPPLYDLLFTTTLPNKIDRLGDVPAGETCDPGPVINFTGTADRCIIGP